MIFYNLHQIKVRKKQMKCPSYFKGNIKYYHKPRIDIEYRDTKQIDNFEKKNRRDRVKEKNPFYFLFVCHQSIKKRNEGTHYFIFER